nr:LON peptidase substrate-binding domain-containing protein [Shewanella sp. Isolate11]
MAVFPLPLFILPDGIQRLRIFEPRYLSMVAESVANSATTSGAISTESSTESLLSENDPGLKPRLENQAVPSSGFVISRFDDSLPFKVPNWGTRVEVIDFHAGEDGILVIDVKGMQLVNLSQFYYRTDKLLIANVDMRSHWTEAEKDAEILAISDALQQIFEQHPALAKQYPQPRFDDPIWVCSRFLEVLPLSLNEKEKFIQPNRFHALKTFLYTYLFGNDNKN